MKPSWVKMIPSATATASVVHELPAMTKTTHAARRAPTVEAIFSR
jgi:hypothetical protein